MQSDDVHGQSTKPDSYAILKEYDGYFRIYLAPHEDERMIRFRLEKLERDVQWDIGLIINDLECHFDEHTRKAWSKKIEEAAGEFKRSKADMYEYIRFKRMSQYIGNIIVVMVIMEDYETAKSLLNIYNKYLIKDEEYIGLEKFVRREAERNTNSGMLKEMLGLFSLESHGMHKFFNNFDELLKSEMTMELSLSEKENRVIELLSKGTSFDARQCFELIRNAQEKYIKHMDKENEAFDFYSSYFETGLKKLQELLKADPLYDDVEKGLEDEYGQELWRKFTDETKKYLVTGSVLNDYLIKKSDSDKFDYSPVCLCWARSVEGEFQKKFFMPLIRAYNNSLRPGNRDIKYPQSSFMLEKNKVRGSDRADIKKFTLGSLRHVSGINGTGIPFNVPDWNRFNQFLKNNVYKQMDDTEMKRHMAKLVAKSEKLNTDYRIKAAHPLETLNKSEMELCRDIIFQTQELLKLIVKDMDEDWRIKSLSFS